MIKIKKRVNARNLSLYKFLTFLLDEFLALWYISSGGDKNDNHNDSKTSDNDS